MAISKWDPFNNLDRFFGDMPFSAVSKMGWDLAVDVYEKGDKVFAEMNIPGVDPERINISVEDGQLRIAGSREESTEEKEKDYYSREIRRGSFERTVYLPCPIKKDKVEATYEDGRLTVTMPKTKEADENKVKVKVKK